jgi:hypothetical protein
MVALVKIQSPKEIYKVNLLGALILFNVSTKAGNRKNRLAILPVSHHLHSAKHSVNGYIDRTLITAKRGVVQSTIPLFVQNLLLQNLPTS